MPNWCMVTIRVMGPGLVVRKLMQTVAPDVSPGSFSLQEYFPMPEEAGIVERVEAWGTKWDVYDEDVVGDIRIVEDRDDDWLSATWQSESAWSPPLPAMKRLSELFPTVYVQCTWDEAGNDFSGDAVYKAGDKVYLREHEFSLDNLLSRRDDHGWLAGIASAE